jgi:hypothetical protein
MLFEALDVGRDGVFGHLSRLDQSTTVRYAGRKGGNQLGKPTLWLGARYAVLTTR